VTAKEQPPMQLQTGVLDIKFDELVALIFRDVGPILLEIYRVYFQHEVKGYKSGMSEDLMWKQNEKQVFDFMKDFDIFPSLLSKSVAFKIFTHTQDSDEVYK